MNKRNTNLYATLFLISVVFTIAGCRPSPLNSPAPRSSPPAFDPVVEIPAEFVPGATIGEGQAQEVLVDPRGIWMLVQTTAGVFLYDAKTWERQDVPFNGMPVNELAVSGDGRYLALLLTGNEEIQLWEIDPPQLRHTWSGLQSTPLGLRFSMDSEFLIYATFQEISLLLTESGEKRGSFTPPEGSQFIDLAVSADGQLISATVADGGQINEVVGWEPATGNSISIIPAVDELSAAWILDGDFSADRSTFAALASDGSLGKAYELIIADSGGQGVIARLQSELEISNLSWLFSRSGNQVYSGHADGTVRIWSVASEDLLQELPPPVAAAVKSIHLVADGESLIVVHTGGDAFVWSLTTGDLQGSIDLKRGTLPLKTYFHPFLEQFFLVKPDGSVQVVHGETGRLLVELREHRMGAIRDLDFSPDGRQIAAAMANNRVAFWSSSGETANAPHFPDHGGRVDSVAFSSDGRMVATGVGQRMGPLAFDDTIRLWTLPDGQLSWQNGGDGETVSGCTLFRNRVLFTPDNQYLLANSHNFSVEMLKRNDGSLVQEFRGHSGPLLDMSISSDGRLLATASQDGEIRLWRTADGEMVRKWENHLFGFLAADIAADNALLAGATFAAEIIIWDINSGAELRRLEGNMNPGSELKFYADGAILAAGYGDDLLLWSTETGQIIGGLPGTGTVISVAFAADGQTVAFGGEDGRIHIWKRVSSAEY